MWIANVHRAVSEPVGLSFVKWGAQDGRAEEEGVRLFEQLTHKHLLCRHPFTPRISIAEPLECQGNDVTSRVKYLK